MPELDLLAIPFCFFLFGACVGSFLNVVIYRMPRGMSVNTPRRSFCPHCGAPIAWYRNIPLLSWLLLRGKGACCGKPIAVRYWLVELVCALLFTAIAWCFPGEELPTLALLCLWSAIMLACFCIDWETMAVLPSLTLIATACGLAAAGLSPWLLEPMAEPAEALTLAATGAAGGFLLFKLVGLLGKLLFGRRRKTWAVEQPWTLCQEGEDLRLTIGNDSFLWTELFLEEHDRLLLTDATAAGQTETACTLAFTLDKLHLPDGTELPLESVESLHGTCRGLQQQRAAMGSGDAWLAMAIGALCGWQGVVFALVAGSFIGLAQAAVARIGRGQPMPFGPALIAAAFIWLFFSEEILSALAAWYGLS